VDPFAYPMPNCCLRLETGQSSTHQGRSSVQENSQSDSVVPRVWWCPPCFVLFKCGWRSWAFCTGRGHSHDV